VSIGPGNHLKAIREREGISTAALATAAGVSERIIRRVEEIDGTPRLEVKARLVTGLNTLISGKGYQTEEVFAGWQAHRRHAKR
jgi:predicted transcriptional regulator